MRRVAKPCGYQYHDMYCATMPCPVCEAPSELRLQKEALERAFKKDLKPRRKSLRVSTRNLLTAVRELFCACAEFVRVAIF